MNSGGDKVVSWPTPFTDASTITVSGSFQGAPGSTGTAEVFGIDTLSVSAFSARPRYISSGGAVGVAGETYSWTARGK